MERRSFLKRPAPVSRLGAVAAPARGRSADHQMAPSIVSFKSLDTIFGGADVVAKASPPPLAASSRSRFSRPANWRFPARA